MHLQTKLPSPSKPMWFSDFPSPQDESFLGRTPKVIHLRLFVWPRTQCKSNLKHACLALHKYHEIASVFPPGWVYVASRLWSNAPINRCGWPGSSCVMSDAVGQCCGNHTRPYDARQRPAPHGYPSNLRGPPVNRATQVGRQHRRWKIERTFSWSATTAEFLYATSSRVLSSPFS
ncbi:MAG: DUF1559 domain-containing protein [Planctomycetota bacterium]|nr:MAG: DUF1559 domain-containing protein [Planctomycetota bacterium]